MKIFNKLFKPNLEKLFKDLKDGDMDDRESALNKLIKANDPHVKEKALAELKKIFRGDLTDVAATGTPKMAKLLIKAGADVNVKTSPGGYTPLLIAAGRGKTDVVKVLLDAGADVNVRGKSGKTALQLAQERGFSDCVKFINNYDQ